MDLKDKTVIVTGSGSGIGRALAVAFARAGSTVVVCGRRKKRLDMTVQMIEAEGAKGLAVEADVTRADDVKRLVETVLKQCGSIDVLFNNAGSFRSIAGVFEVDPELWWQDVTVNLLGPLLTMRMVMPHMMKRDQGIIINMNGGRPVGGTGYAAGKAGLMELTRLAAEELFQEESSVMVFGAGPGLVRTEMTALQAETEAGQQWIPSTKENFDAGTVRKPEDIAEKTVELCRIARPELSGKRYGPDTDFTSPEWTA